MEESVCQAALFFSGGVTLLGLLVLLGLYGRAIHGSARATFRAWRARSSGSEEERQPVVAHHSAHGDV